jgi:DNA modification methylase
MGKQWDYDVPSTQIWEECMRVLKPGGHLLAFAGSRTYHRMAVRIEDAGFEIRDMISWLYGSGFPKSMDISKQIDKTAGRINNPYSTIELKKKLIEIVKSSGKSGKQIDSECGFRAMNYLTLPGEEKKPDPWVNILPSQEKWKIMKDVLGCEDDISVELDAIFYEAEREIIGIQTKARSKNSSFTMPTMGDVTEYKSWDITLPQTDEAKKWQGWGTALKPAHEPVVMARKPLEENTVVDNVLKWGTGGINIDESRIPTDEDQRRPSKGGENGLNNTNTFKIRERTVEEQPKHEGRFPANLILDEEAGEMLDEQTGVLSSGFMKAGTARLMSDNPNKNTYGKWNPDTVANDTYGDSGGASRFFYCPKVSKSERNEGLGDFPIKQSSSMSGRRSPEDMSAFKIDNDVTGRFVTERQNIHPTVKPVDLMLYLIRLVTPKGGVTLDPFMGSGSSGKAAVRGGFDFIGIEREDEYFKIAEARIEYERNKPIIVETPTGKKVEVKKEVEEKVNQFFG